MTNATGAMGYVLQSYVTIHTGNHETDGQQRSLRSWFGKSPEQSEADISGNQNHVQQQNLETSKETSKTKKQRRNWSRSPQRHARQRLEIALNTSHENKSLELH